MQIEKRKSGTKMTTAQSKPRKLSEPERSQILRDVVATKVTSQGGVFGQVSSSGMISMRRTGPFVREWGATSAEVAFGNWLTHPAVIVLNTMSSLFTCGLYLPWWFFRTFKKPPLSTLSIDEYGHEHWEQHAISQGQKILRVVLLVVMVLWV
jgi:hypothetical protein